MPNWLIALAGAIPAAIISWLLHTVDIDRIEKKAQTQQEDLRAADKKQCDTDKSITKEANDALQKDHDNIAARYAQLMQQPQTCVPISNPSQLSRSGKSGHAGQNGVPSGALRQYAAECEQYRRTLKICITFANSLPK